MQDPQEQVASAIRADAKVERQTPPAFDWRVVAWDVPSSVAANIGLSVLAVTSGSGWGALWMLPGFSYMLGAPILHWREGGGWKGSLSLGMHLAGFVAASFANVGTICALTPSPWGCNKTSNGGDSGSGSAAAVGAVAGAVILAIPTVVDALLLSTNRTEHAWRAQTAWVPTLQVRQGGAVAGVGTAF